MADTAGQDPVGGISHHDHADWRSFSEALGANGSNMVANRHFYGGVPPLGRPQVARPRQDLRAHIETGPWIEAIRSSDFRNSEFGIRDSGIRNSEFGIRRPAIRNSELGIRISEFGIRDSEFGDPEFGDLELGNPAFGRRNLRPRLREN